MGIAHVFFVRVQTVGQQMQPHVQNGSALIVTCTSVDHAARSVRNTLRLDNHIKEYQRKVPRKGREALHPMQNSHGHGQSVS